MAVSSLVPSLESGLPEDDPVAARILEARMTRKSRVIHRREVLVSASRDCTAVCRFEVLNDEAERADVVKMWLVGLALAYVEEEERVTLAELPAGVRRPTVRLPDFELCPEDGFVELDRLIDAPHTDVDGDRPEPLD